MTEISCADPETPNSETLGQACPVQSKWMDQTAAANYLTRIGVRISPKTLQKRRVVGGGPQFRKIMGRVVYEPGSLETWAAEQLARSPLVTSTSEYDE